MRIAMVGCGQLAAKRVRSLAGGHLVVCADVLGDRAQALARTTPGATATTAWPEAIERSDVDIVVVSTPNDTLPEITIAAVEAGKHVLVEKPAACRASDLDQVRRASERANRFVRVGFNHRYHPTMQKARQLVDSGAIGDLMFVRGRYGHGGRIGYEKEWRADPLLSGGGELIDQGIHLIDLARWFLGDFVNVQGFTPTYFWNMPVEDNAFMLLRTERQKAAFLHASCTEWKNLFSLEIYGQLGKLDIAGLGGSYGTERIAYYRMLPEMGPPETTIWEYPMADRSLEIEFAEFLEDIRLGRKPAASLADAQAALRVIERIYELSDQ